jgi:hypothetical protein
MPAFSAALGFNAGTSFSSLRQPLIVIVAFAGVARFGTCMAGGLGRSGDCGVGALLRRLRVQPSWMRRRQTRP